MLPRSVASKAIAASSRRCIQANKLFSARFINSKSSVKDAATV